MGLAGRLAKWQHRIGWKKSQMAARDWLESELSGSTGLVRSTLRGWVQWVDAPWGSRTRAGGAGGAQAAPGAGCDPHQSSTRRGWDGDRDIPRASASSCPPTTPWGTTAKHPRRPPARPPLGYPKPPHIGPHCNVEPPSPAGMNPAPACLSLQHHSNHRAPAPRRIRGASRTISCEKLLDVGC